jgi:hypothetical protein
MPKTEAIFDPTDVNAVQAFVITTKTTNTGNKKRNPETATVFVFFKNDFINFRLVFEKKKYYFLAVRSYCWFKGTGF